MSLTPAHTQKVSHSYLISYPAHAPRTSDPHYVDFRAWKVLQRKAGKWRCAYAVEVGEDHHCDLTRPLEAHHAHLEFALLNAVDFVHLEGRFPGISDPTQVGAWIETDANLALYCVKHHRGQGSGLHQLDAALFEASKWVLPDTIR